MAWAGIPLAPSHQVSGFHGICRHHATSCYADCKSVGDAGLVGWPDETASWAFAHLRDADRLMQTNRKLVSLERLTVMLSSLAADRREVTAEEEIAEDKWLTRQELADRYGLPVKTPAEWASKGTGPRYAKIGRHVRYRLSDVIDWGSKQFNEDKRSSA